MKPGPVIAMVVLILLGMWLVLQPTLRRGGYDYEVRVGSTEMLIDDLDDGRVRFVAPERLAALGPMGDADARALVRDEVGRWMRKPLLARTLLGFFNISGWASLVWVAVGLSGQAAFFGRMFVQWIISEKHRRSEVPEVFWWLSLVGGLCLFCYFVWRVDIVGVLGQSTGVVIYARNLRLIQKSKRKVMAGGDG